MTLQINAYLAKVTQLFRLKICQIEVNEILPKNQLHFLGKIKKSESGYVVNKEISFINLIFQKCLHVNKMIQIKNLTDLRKKILVKKCL